MTKQEKTQVLPIIPSKKVIDEIPMKSLSVYAFRWEKKPFVDLETGEEIYADMWCMVASADLGKIVRTGVKTSVKKPYNYVYGYEALSHSLSQIFPCSVEHAKKMIEQAKAQNIRSVKFCLKSDLVPTSKERYTGENKWVCLAQYPLDMDKRINEALKLTDSTLRLKRGLKWKLHE